MQAFAASSSSSNTLLQGHNISSSQRVHYYLTVGMQLISPQQGTVSYFANGANDILLIYSLDLNFDTHTEAHRFNLVLPITIRFISALKCSSSILQLLLLQLPLKAYSTGEL